MRSSILIFFILSLSNLKAQNLDRLDAVNGFRKFKFGMSPTQFQSIVLQKSGVNLRDVKFYSYIGKDISEFNGVAIEEITLSFYKNRLYGIQVGFGTVYKEYTKSEFKMVQEGLESNFGYESHQCEDEDSNTTECVIFDANRVRVESVRIYMSERDGTRKKEFNYIQGYMLFTDKIISQERRKSEIENLVIQ